MATMCTDNAPSKGRAGTGETTKNTAADAMTLSKSRIMSSKTTRRVPSQEAQQKGKARVPGFRANCEAEKPAAAEFRI